MDKLKILIKKPNSKFTCCFYCAIIPFRTYIHLGGIMRKIIMFIFLILSLGTMIAFTASINDLLSFFDFGIFDLDEILYLLENNDLDEILPTLGFVLWGLFQLYGIPLIVFLVSLNGLAIKKN